MNTTLIEPTAARRATPPLTRRQGAGWRALATVNFLALVAAALILRGWQLGNIPGLNGDEAWLGVQAAHLAAGEPIAWQTPTGNPVNLLLLLPVAALHLVFAPSVTVLRLTALASGVAALAMNFWLCRRVFDRRTALVSTSVLAVLPIAIAYSRFAWDASQTLLATVLVLYFAMSTVAREVSTAGQPGQEKNWFPKSRTPPDWLPALVAFGAAIWIHPTNVFAIWLLIVPAVYHYGDDWRTAIRAAWQAGGGPASSRLTRGLSRGAMVATGGLALAAGGWFCRGLLGTMGSRLLDPQQGGLFLRRLVQLFSGSTILDFIPGRTPTSSALDIADVAFVSLTGVAALGLVQRLRRADSGRERCLAWAMALMIGTFYLVAGPAALAPHFERYGMCLVAPGSVLLAVGWSYWLGNRGRGGARAGAASSSTSRRPLQSRAAGVVLATAAWLWLAVFYCEYFLVFRSSGGVSHVAFRTAPVEPKLAALKAIEAAEKKADESAPHGAKKQIWIVADSWWSYWPLAYFAARRHEIHVVSEQQWQAESRQVAGADALWRVKFTASDALPESPASAVAEIRPAGKITIRDYSGMPLLTLERLTEVPDRPTAAED